MQSSILNYVTSDNLPMFRKPRHTKQIVRKNEKYVLPTRESRTHESEYVQQPLDKAMINPCKKRKITVADEEEFEKIFDDDDFIHDVQSISPGNFKQGND